MAFSFFERDDSRVEARLESGQVAGNVDTFFLPGLEINLELLPQHYPGWILRLYHDIEERDPLMETLCGSVCKYPYLDLCNASHLPTTVLTGIGICTIFHLCGMNLIFRFIQNPPSNMEILPHLGSTSRLSTVKVGKINSACMNVKYQLQRPGQQSDSQRGSCSG